MYVSVSDGPAYARFYKFLSSNQITGTQDPNNFRYGNDCFLTCLGLNYGQAIVTDPVRIRDVIGCAMLHQEHPAPPSFLTEKPENFAYSFWDDRRRYGDLFGGAFLPDESGYGSASRHEKGVSHPSFTGDLSDSLGSKDLYDPNGNLSYYGILIPRLTPKSTNVRSKFYTDGTTDLGYLRYLLSANAYILPGGHIRSDFWECFNKILSEAEGKSFPGSALGGILNWGWTFHYTNIVNNSHKSYNSWYVDVEYDYEMRFDIGSGVISGRYHVHLLYFIGLRKRYGTNLPGPDGGIGLDEAAWVYKDDSYAVYVSHSAPYYIPTPTVDTFPRFQPYDYTPCFSDVYQASTVGSNFSYLRKAGGSDDKRLYRRHMSLLSTMMPDLRPASFISSADALNKNIESLHANHVQNAQQLPGILELLPDIGSLIPLITKVIKGDPSALKELVDYITDAILRFRFAQKPTYDDLTELEKAQIAEDVGKLLSSKSLTAQGVFDWTFPAQHNSWGDGELVLTVRSKLRLTSDISTLMAALLTANSVGLLPTLARVWETLPFTFVIDWFTAMNKRLKLVDNQLLFASVFRADWCLHSYKLSWYPSAEYLNQYGLVSSSEKPFAVTAYLREFSCRTPRLRDSRYDFLAPTHGPDPVTVGALIWQVIT